MKTNLIIEPHQLQAEDETVIFDCRFSLTDPDSGRASYEQGHIPGAFYLDVDQDLSAPVQKHGGRHPLPDATAFAALLASYGVNSNTKVVAYDDNRFAGASRLWWMMKSIGYRPPCLLNGGYRAWLANGGDSETQAPVASSVAPPSEVNWTGHCDIEGIKKLQKDGAVVVDSREERRYQGLEEPIDPVAGHIPGAINRPWQDVTNEQGQLLLDEQKARWNDTAEAEQLVVYCGSGLTACVNLFSLALLERDDAILYGGSWSDWCSYL